MTMLFEISPGTPVHFHNLKLHLSCIPCQWLRKQSRKFEQILSVVPLNILYWLRALYAMKLYKFIHSMFMYRVVEIPLRNDSTREEEQAACNRRRAKVQQNAKAAENRAETSVRRVPSRCCQSFSVTSLRSARFSLRRSWGNQDCNSCCFFFGAPATHFCIEFFVRAARTTMLVNQSVTSACMTINIFMLVNNVPILQKISRATVTIKLKLNITYCTINKICNLDEIERSVLLTRIIYKLIKFHFVLFHISIHVVPAVPRKLDSVNQE